MSDKDFNQRAVDICWRMHQQIYDLALDRNSKSAEIVLLKRKIAELEQALKESKGIPDEIRLYYMRDNHTFARIYGINWDQIWNNAYEHISNSPDGMLCGAMIMYNNKEINRIGKDIHVKTRYYHNGVNIGWSTSIDEWVDSLIEDEDVKRLLPTNVSYE